MGGKAVPSAIRMTLNQAETIYKEVINKIFPKLGLSPRFAKVIGSYGKKLENEDYGDIDIAVDVTFLPVNPLLYLERMLNELGFDTYLMKGSDQISFGVFMPGSSDLAQVDLMLTPNMKWSDFIYHSPDKNLGESNYKGTVRNLLIFAIITESFRKVIKLDEDNEIEEFEHNIIRMPTGVWRIRKSYKGKKSRLKNPKIMKEFDRFISVDPQEVTNLLVGNGFVPGDLDSFEKLWHIISSSDFIYKDKLAEIIIKFKKNLICAGLEMPKEII